MDLRGLLETARAGKGLAGGGGGGGGGEGRGSGSGPAAVGTAAAGAAGAAAVAAKPSVKVEGLSASTTVQELAAGFAACGAVERATVVGHKRFGVVMFATEAGAAAALRLDGTAVQIGGGLPVLVAVSAGPGQAKKSKKAKKTKKTTAAKDH